MTHRNDRYRIGFARLGIFIFFASIAGIIYTPLNISYKSTSGNGAAAAAVDGNAAAANKRIEFRGFAGLVSAPLIMLLSTFIALLVFVLEVPAVPGVGLVCVQVACFLEVSTFARRAHADTPINLESNKPDVFYSSELNWPAAVAWFLFATQCFYATVSIRRVCACIQYTWFIHTFICVDTTLSLSVHPYALYA